MASSNTGSKKRKLGDNENDDDVEVTGSRSLDARLVRGAPSPFHHPNSQSYDTNLDNPPRRRCPRRLEHNQQSRSTTAALTAKAAVAGAVGAAGVVVAAAAATRLKRC